MKKKHYFILCFVTLLLFTACSSTKLVQEYKNPDTSNFHASKILIIGISLDKELRRTYETKMMDAFEKEQINAVKSIDFFESSFTDNEKSIKDLNEIQNQLKEAGFDTILFTKTTGQESRLTPPNSFNHLASDYRSFEDYYFNNQHVYFREDQERYSVYITETSLFCICQGKDRELIWRGKIEVESSPKVNKNINSYLSVVFKALRENNLL